MAISADPVPRGPVTASLNFTKRPEPGHRLFNYVDAPPEGEPQNNVETDAQTVTIRDVRGSETSYSLDKDAFQIIQGVAPSSEKEFLDDDSIKSNYYPEVEDLLLKNVPGSRRVFIFDHTVRRPGPESKRSAVLRAHIDQTATSTAKRVRTHMGDEADALLEGRYRIINVWRALNRDPVEANPLAFASSSSLQQEDVLPVEHRYPHGYVGETAGIAFNPTQRWYYLSGMTGDERLLLECFDSEGLKDGSGVEGGRLPHSAFEDPRTRAEAEGRSSIEVRALVFGP